MVSPLEHNVRRVTRTLARHGFAGLLTANGFSQYLPWHHRRSTPLPHNIPQQLANALTELDGGYQLLGHFLKTRPDLTPHAAYFTNVQNTGRPQPVTAIIRAIEHSFHKPLNQLFTHLDPRPLTSSLLVQTHKARTTRGDPVTVHVHKPAALHQLNQDLPVIRFLAHKLRNHHTLPALAAFEHAIAEHLDFTTTAKHITAAKNNTLTLPRVHNTLTRTHVLTVDYYDGTPLATHPHKHHHLTRAINQHLAHPLYTPVHPNNLIILPNNALSLRDVSTIARPSHHTHELIKTLATSLSNPAQTLNILLATSNVTSTTNLAGLQHDLAHLKQQGSANTILRILHHAHQRGLTLPHDALPLAAALARLEPSDTFK